MVTKHKATRRSGAVRGSILNVSVTPDTRPQWVRSMHVHFHEKGYYRAEDLARLVGDPRQSVSVSLSGDVSDSCAATKAT